MSLNMSLFYVFTHSFDLPNEYKCPENLTVSIVPRPLLGSYFLASGIVFITLYFPCFLAILKLNLKILVYQLMLVLSIFDIAALSMHSVTTGIFDILGVWFCQYPLPIFLYGAVGQTCWMSGSACSTLLAVERCAEINPKFPLEILFRKSVFPFVLVALILFSLWCFLFVKPVLFSVVLSSWIYNPLIGTNPELYDSNPDTICNIVLVVTTSLLYIYLSYNLIFKFSYSTSIWLYKTKRQIIFQAIILCVFHAIVAGLYEFMRFFYYSPTLIIISQVLWGWSSGCMCIAYLTFNRTIRNLVIKIIIPKSIRMRYGIHVDFEEHLAHTEAAHNVGTGIVNAGGCVIRIDNFIHFD